MGGVENAASYFTWQLVEIGQVLSFLPKMRDVALLVVHSINENRQELIRKGLGKHPHACDTLLLVGKALFVFEF